MSQDPSGYVLYVCMYVCMYICMYCVCRVMKGISISKACQHLCTCAACTPGALATWLVTSLHLLAKASEELDSAEL